MSTTPKHRQKPHLLRYPFPHLFHSNSTISDEEHAIIIQTIARTRAEITHLLNLESSEGGSDDIYRRRLACEEFISKHEELLHWTRRLPVELLIMIFLCCTEDYTVIPWNISQVCRKWRVTALSTPQLWCRVPVIHEWNNKTTEKQYLHFLRVEYLKRSAKQTLIIPLIKHYERTGSRIFGVLLDHAERWGDMELETKTFSDHFFKNHVHHLEGRMQSLYTLKLTVGDLWPTSAWSLKFLRHAPRLRHFFLDVAESRYNDELDQLCWPWPQVTHLTLIHRSLNTFNLNTLSLFDNLIYIALTRLEMFQMTPSPDGRFDVVFKTCKYLRIDLGSIEGEFVVELRTHTLQHLHCPLLEHLHVTYAYTWLEVAIIPRELASFVRNHSQTLRTLHWEYQLDSSDKLVVDENLACALKDDFPQLKVLRISEPADFLLGPDTAGTLCETLHSLIKNRHRHPSLRKLDIQLNPETKRVELPDICKSLSRLALLEEERAREMIPGANANLQPLETIRLEIYQKTIGATAWADYDIPGTRHSQVDVLLEIEGWAQGLREGWETQVRLEVELKRVKKWAEELQQLTNENTFELAHLQIEETLRGGLDLEVTDARVLIVHDLPRKLKRILEHVVMHPQIHSSIPDVVERLFSQWTHLFQHQVPTRRWAMVGDNRILYIPPRSPLHADISTWIFGLEEERGKIGYLRQGSLPELTDPEIIP